MAHLHQKLCENRTAAAARQKHADEDNFNKFAEVLKISITAAVGRLTDGIERGDHVVGQERLNSNCYSPSQWRVSDVSDAQRAHLSAWLSGEHPEFMLDEEPEKPGFHVALLIVKLAEDE